MVKRRTQPLGDDIRAGVWGALRERHVWAIVVWYCSWFRCKGEEEPAVLTSIRAARTHLEPHHGDGVEKMAKCGESLYNTAYYRKGPVGGGAGGARIGRVRTGRASVGASVLYAMNMCSVGGRMCSAGSGGADTGASS